MDCACALVAGGRGLSAVSQALNLSRAQLSVRVHRKPGWQDIATDEDWLYLAGLKDVFTCEIVGYAMGERMTTGLVSQALFRAVQQKRPPAGLLIHHTDRGSQYCAKAYRALQVQFGMQTSMSRKGNCFDNAPIESFWGSLKNELVHHHRFKTRAEAKAAIQEYIEIFYNRQRRHSRLGNISPAEFTKRYWRTAQAA